MLSYPELHHVMSHRQGKMRRAVERNMTMKKMKPHTKTPIFL